MTRLPQPGGDQDTWGNVLNDFLSQSHNTDGTLKTDTVGPAQLKPSAVASANLADGAVTSQKLDTATQTSLTKADGSLQASNDLSDVPTPATARTNLGLGPAATMTTAQIAADGALTGTYAQLHATRRVASILSGTPKVVTAFQSGHGWAASGTGSTDLNATDDFLFGSQSVKLMTDGSGSGSNATIITRTPSTANDLTGRQLVLLVKCSDPANVRTLNLYAGTGGLTNYQLWTMAIGQFDILQDGWLYITLPVGESTAGAAGWTRNSVDTFRLSATDRGAAVTFHVQGIYSVPEPTQMTNGLVSFTFDDSYASVYSRAMPYMGRYGFAGTTFTIADQIGVVAGRLTAPNLQDLEGLGWEVAAHAYTETLHTATGGFTALDAATLDAELRRLRAWFDANHLRGGDHFAYPQGLTNDAVRAAVRKYFASARMYTNTYLESLPPGDSHFMRSAGVLASTTTASLTAKIDKAYANNEWLVMTFHDIVASGATGTQYDLANFQTVVNYAASKGIAVRTIGSALRLVS